VAVAYNIPLITTLSGAAASVQGIEALLQEEVRVKSLQEYHQKVNSTVEGTQRPQDPFHPKERNP
jgi:hypothetical protein